MNLPFTQDAFLDVFVRYHEALWPAPVVLTALALAALGLAFVPWAGRGRAVSLLLAALWAWAGLAYHWAFFAAINPLAWGFGGLFLVQALVLAWLGGARGALDIAPARSLATYLGAGLVVYALLLYPLIGVALGHRYPAAPTFGLPCPTTLFTIGLLAFLRRPFPAAVLAIPLAWSLVGLTAVFGLGMWEDLGLLAAALVAAYLLAANARAPRTESSPRDERLIAT